MKRLNRSDSSHQLSDLRMDDFGKTSCVRLKVNTFLHIYCSSSIIMEAENGVLEDVFSLQMGFFSLP